MKTTFKKNDAYKDPKICISHKDMDKKSCLKGKAQDDTVTLKEIMKDGSFTVRDRMFWLMEKSTTSDERDELYLYFKERVLANSGKVVNIHEATILYMDEDKSPLKNKSEFNALLKQLDLT